MVFPVVGGDGKPTGYEIDNSLRFNDGDSAQLSREFSADPDTRKSLRLVLAKEENLVLITLFWCKNYS